MANFTIDKNGNIDLKDHVVTGVGIQRITDVTSYKIDVEAGRVTHVVTFSNGGGFTASWNTDGSQFRTSTVSKTNTSISDDPNFDKGVILTISAAKETPVTLQ